MMTVAQLWVYVQIRSLDTATSGNALALATDGYPLLNRAYRIVAAKSSRRNTREDATTLGTIVDINYAQNRMFFTPQNLTDVVEVFASTVAPFNVASSISSGATNLTTVSDFLAAGVVVGMRVSHASLPSRTFVKAIVSATSLTLSDKATGAIAAANVSFRNTAGLPLQQEDYGQVERLVQREGDVGTPSIYGIRRAQAATLDGVGNIELLTYPIASGDYAFPGTLAYFPAMVRYALTDLAATTDVTDVEDGEDYLIGDIAAYFSCVIQGRQIQAGAILAELPDYYREAAIQAAKTLPRPEVSVAS